MTRILLVEDEESYRDPLTFQLERDGFAVTAVDNGADAILAYERSTPDIVLLDLMLPQTSGTEVCRELRRRGSTPVIMLTAKDTEIDKVVGLELGADDYVTKPYSYRELLARIRSLGLDGFELTHSGAPFVEVLAPGVSKAWGLQQLCTRLGIDAEEVLAFGDAPNDAEMLAWAGRGVAMANAAPVTLAAADEVTVSNLDDGVAQVIEAALTADRTRC